MNFKRWNKIYWTGFAIGLCPIMFCMPRDWDRSEEVIGLYLALAILVPLVAVVWNVYSDLAEKSETDESAREDEASGDGSGERQSPSVGQYIGIAAMNLVPAAGVLFLDWDLGWLFIYYWVEIGAIGLIVFLFIYLPLAREQSLEHSGPLMVFLVVLLGPLLLAAAFPFVGGWLYAGHFIDQAFEVRTRFEGFEVEYALAMAAIIAQRFFEHRGRWGNFDSVMSLVVQGALHVLALVSIMFVAFLIIPALGETRGSLLALVVGKGAVDIVWLRFRGHFAAAAQ